MFNKQNVAVIAVTIVSVLSPSSALAFGGKDKKSDLVPLEATAAIAIAGGAGKFDWMTIDARRRRVLAAHTELGKLEVLNLDTGKQVASIKTGACQGVAVSDKLYFAGDADERKLVVVDADSLRIKGEVKVPGPIDAITYNPRTQTVYAGHDDGADVWAIQAETRTLLGAIPVHGVPEYIEFDKQSNRLYQNVKTTNSVAVIDVETNKVVSTWSTSPAQRPHGLAVDSKKKRIFSAGANGILVSIDMKSGKVTSIVSIGNDADQIAFDADKHRIYCACSGAISVIDAAADELKVVGSVPTHKNATSLAVDLKTHAVWTSYCDEKDSFMQKFDFVE